jgi:MFS family permease
VFLAFYPLGILLSIGIIKATTAASLSWRFDYFFAIIPAILILLFRFKVKESQRYSTVREIRARQKRSRVTLLQAAHDPRLVARILVAGVLVIMPLYYGFYVNTLYGEAFWVKTLHNPLGTYLNWEILINAIWALASILMGLLADKIGYRSIGIAMYALGFLGYGLAYSGLLGTGTEQWILGEVIAVIGLGGAWAIANAHVSSLFPTEVRSAGFGWSSGVARAITIACPTITTALILSVGIHGGLDSAPLVCVLGMVGFLVSRELKGTPLTDLVGLPSTSAPQAGGQM